MPFATMCPIPNTHRFWGRSIADATMDIQRVKTAITRGSLDNMYLALNPGTIVAESLASDTTLDDLLTSRPGRIIRTQQPGAVEHEEIPFVVDKAMPMLQYYDQLREWRTGVSRMQQGLEGDALQQKTATEATATMSAAQQRMKLIARIFAETGIKDMFALLHGCIRRHGDKPRTVRLRNKWVPIDPRDWKTRNDMTISVTGATSRAQRLQEIGLIGQSQEKLSLNPNLSHLVSPKNVYNAAKEMVRAVGHKDVDAYFTDPSDAPPPAASPSRTPSSK